METGSIIASIWLDNCRGATAEPRQDGSTVVHRLMASNALQSQKWQLTVMS